EARRHSGRAAEKARSRHQFDDRQGAQAGNPGIVPIARRRGDRMSYTPAFGGEYRRVSNQARARHRSMDKLLFWLGIGAAQKGARSKEVKPSQHWVISFVVGILLALLIAAGFFVRLPTMRQR